MKMEIIGTPEEIGKLLNEVEEFDLTLTINQNNLEDYSSEVEDDDSYDEFDPECYGCEYFEDCHGFPEDLLSDE